MGEGGRAGRRAFIRDHHPDRGGDPAVFIAGLSRFDGQASCSRPLPRVVAVRRRRWPVRLFLALARRLSRASRPPRVR
jgi:hypothetical protein